MKRVCTMTVLLTAVILLSCDNTKRLKNVTNVNAMIIRLSEIKIDSNYVDEYNAILKEEAAASVKLEPGVLCIHPMQQKNDRTEIRILEIYANDNAYRAHLNTHHFQKYKTMTLKMVKSLRLVDMNAIDPETMTLIFTKINLK